MQFEKELEALRKAVINSQEHVRAGDPARIYSQYLRYAMDQFSGINRYASVLAKSAAQEDVVNDHVVPHAVLMRMLLSLENPSIEDIWYIIDNYYVICTITKGEHEGLRGSALGSRMPDGWDMDTGDVFARYKSAGVSVADSQ